MNSLTIKAFSSAKYEGTVVVGGISVDPPLFSPVVCEASTVVDGIAVDPSTVDDGIAVDPSTVDDGVAVDPSIVDDGTVVDPSVFSPVVWLSLNRSEIHFLQN
jgi:hypothetical protein